VVSRVSSNISKVSKSGLLNNKTALWLVIAFSIIVLAIVIGWYCWVSSSNTVTAAKASEKAIGIAKEAVEVADDYLDGELYILWAEEEMGYLLSEMSYVNNLSDNISTKDGDTEIYMDIFNLYYALYYGQSYDDILLYRNYIASDIGVRRR